MRVTFTKLDAKRYEVSVEREHGPALLPRPGPSLDDEMPHDIEHFVVEEQLGIELGVFGQLAAGGSGIFFPAPQDNTLRNKQRAERIAAEGRSDMARSEELTRVVAAVRDGSATRGATRVSARCDEVAAAVRRLDELAREWAALAPGESLTLTWPDRLTVRMGGTRRGRRPTRDAGRRR
jgi:hypothetical protein